MAWTAVAVRASWSDRIAKTNSFNNKQHYKAWTLCCARTPRQHYICHSRTLQEYAFGRRDITARKAFENRSTQALSLSSMRPRHVLRFRAHGQTRPGQTARQMFKPPTREASGTTHPVSLMAPTLHTFLNRIQNDYWDANTRLSNEVTIQRYCDQSYQHHHKLIIFFSSTILTITLY